MTDSVIPPSASETDTDARLRELEETVGLLLEIIHEMVNDLHAPKVNWDRRMIPIWKRHIERKRNTTPDNAR